MLAMHGHVNADGSFNWREALLDATVLMGTTFFTTLGAAQLTGQVGTRELLSAALAALGQFCTVLAVKRGLVE